MKADAIVNAANTGLSIGGGVCGAIFQAAGVEKLTEACRRIGGCPTGSGVVTPAFDIASAKVIIHAVGPIYAPHSAEESRRLLLSAHESAMKLAAENGCKTVAFPAISTGIYGYPLREACQEAVDVCRAEAKRLGTPIKLVAFDHETADCLRRHLENTAHCNGDPRISSATGVQEGSGKRLDQRSAGVVEVLRHRFGHRLKMLWLIAAKTLADRVEERCLILVIGPLDEHVGNVVMIDVNILRHDKSHARLLVWCALC
ncbi:MAG: macro domain-containing protein [Geminicoccaceae bacterium]